MVGDFVREIIVLDNKNDINISFSSIILQIEANKTSTCFKIGLCLKIWPLTSYRRNNQLFFILYIIRNKLLLISISIRSIITLTLPLIFFTNM